VDATFLFVMIGLKIPIGLLLYIVWWAIKSEPEPQTPTVDEDGGAKNPRHPHRRPRRPRPPRRGPHGDPALPPPSRTRTVVARARRVEHRH
jgi:hypothetical protein